MDSLRRILNKDKAIIIAEIGVNHDGCICDAKEMIDCSIENGADVVKFQYWHTELLQHRKYTTEEWFDLLCSLELSIEELISLKEFTEKRGGVFLCTPDEESAAYELANFLNMDWVKIGSGEIDNFFFLDYISELFDGVILSTGASSLDIVREAVKHLNVETLVLMHTVSCYPTEFSDLNLKRIEKLKKIEGVDAVGFSDHSISIYPATAAIALGAKVIEKHFTMSRKRKGPDHAASIEPHELNALRKAVDEVWEAIKEKESIQCEKETSKIFRKGGYWKRSKKKGDILTKEDVITKRPCMGLSLPDIYNMIGKKISRDVNKFDPIKEEDF